MPKSKVPTHISAHFRTESLENIWREDVVDEQRQFTQSEALANARRTHNGYFVVDRILEEKNA